MYYVDGILHIGGYQVKLHEFVGKVMIFVDCLLKIEWLGDNHFLLQKHRPPANSVRECLISVASIHSETVNIWTHLIGALAVAVTFTLFLVDNHRQMDITDFISFSLFFISAILCLTFSTLLHIFINYSPRVMVIVSKLDYMGKRSMSERSLLRVF